MSFRPCIPFLLFDDAGICIILLLVLDGLKQAVEQTDPRHAGLTARPKVLYCDSVVLQ